MYGNRLSAVVETAIISGERVYSEFRRSVEFDRGRFHRQISDSAPNLRQNIEFLISDYKVPMHLRETIRKVFDAKKEAILK